ncbi:hypothetical protein ACOI1C_13570 [Bacillus sp. DJP31]|uniref:hypothetical protein n=1 Tax=Bacillus sp. DJP31 TaxID=3409789 RepID=UPI003BB5AA4B
MDEPKSTDFLPVVHHHGTGYVKWASWSDFLDGYNFKGVYKPKSYTSSSDRDLFVSMGRRLVTEAISYNVGYQVYYDTGASGSWVEADEITSMRCDGVVEWIYEWYGHRVYGSDTKWDVSKADYWIRDHHGGTLITPKRQKDYMSLVTASTPK